MRHVFRGLASLRALRGTPLDIFGYTAERRMERKLVDEYRALIDDLLPRLGDDCDDTLVDLARLPEAMRGYGHVKERNVERATERRRALLESLDEPRAVELRRAG